MRSAGFFSIIFLFGIAVMAEEVSSMVNLGFSDDARYFMYGEYGISDNRPYATIAVVDTTKNQFVDPFPIAQTFTVAELSPEETGLGALFSLLHKHADLISRHRIDLLAKGRPIYVSVNGAQSRLEFRDFVTDTNYEVTLQQQHRNRESSRESQFLIEGRIQESGSVAKSFVTGRSDLFRKQVRSYEISKILLSPSPSSALVFFVQKNEEINNVPRIRYMVETVIIP